MTVPKTQGSFLLMIRLITAEWFKIEHPRRLLLLMLSPALVTAFIGWFAGHRDGIFLDIAAWQEVWQTILFFWSCFAFSFFIAVLAARLNGIEHSNNSWRMMLTLPLRPYHLFFAKLSLEWGLLFFANIMMILVYSLAFLVSSHSSMTGYGFDMALVKSFFLLPFVMLPVLLIQHALSWFLTNTRFPVIFGNICSLASLPVSSYFQDKGWLLYPWDYGLRFVHDTLDLKMGEKIFPVSQGSFLAFALILFLVASAAVTVVLKQRDIH
ncbi:MAG: ABC transporter permease [Zymomonas mobilis]|uniref:ABC transporter permease n=1 Tax=Zymomonas mobilis TaxID=542 RepID=UPI0039E97F6F